MTSRPDLTITTRQGHPDFLDLELTHRLATTAGVLALPFFRQTVAQETKPDGTLVSEVDHLLEASILETLLAERPDDPILAEESGDHGSPQSLRRWIVDPLDMTEAFLRGEPGWGTHITLEVGGEIQLAVITRPVPNLHWWAQRGHGAYRSSSSDPLDRSTRLRVSGCTSLNEANVGGFAGPDSKSWKVLSHLRPAKNSGRSGLPAQPLTGILHLVQHRKRSCVCLSQPCLFRFRQARNVINQ